MQTITLNDIYGDLRAISEDELLYHVVDTSKGNIKIQITWMNTDELTKLKTGKRDITILEAFRQFAISEQIDTVDDYIHELKHGARIPKHVIILVDNQVIDGHHRVVAAIQIGIALPVVNLVNL